MYPKSDHFHAVKNNKIKLLAELLVEVLVLASFLFISSTLTLSFASISETVYSTQPPSIGRINNQTLIKNNDGGIIILKGATLIDGTGALPKSSTTIAINGSKIVYVSNGNATNNYNLPSSAVMKVINLTGKYVIPGLFDMHSHVANVLKNSYNQTESEYMLHMLLAYGVTTIRNPGGPTGQSVALKENVSEGKIAGPQVFTAGQLLNTPQIPIPFIEKQVETEQDVRQEVSSQAAAGVDFVKLYVGLTPELVQAAIDEAHSQGIRV